MAAPIAGTIRINVPSESDQSPKMVRHSAPIGVKPIAPKTAGSTSGRRPVPRVDRLPLVVMDTPPQSTPDGETFADATPRIMMFPPKGDSGELAQTRARATLPPPAARQIARG